MADVVIVGGGVIGLTTAYFLAREGATVAVLDKVDFGKESSWAGAGILPPAGTSPARTPYEQLRDTSARLFPSLSADLRERTGTDNGYLPCGGIELVHGADDEWHAGSEGLEVLDEAATRKLEPAIAAGLGTSIFLPDMAQVRNPRHLKALLAACAALGVRLLPGQPVSDFIGAGNKVKAVRTMSETIAADQFLLTGGAWTDSLLARLGAQLGIVPVRGQIALLSLPAPAFRRIVLQGKQYLVPRADGRVLVGSTEEDAGFDKRTTAAAIEQLLALAARLVPALKNACLERCWAGLRPGSPDDLPFLGAVPGYGNVFVAAGHFRSGISLSPATALAMKELILGQPLQFSLEPFRLDRTSHSTSPSAARA